MVDDGRTNGVASRFGGTGLRAGCWSETGFGDMCGARISRIW